MTAWQQGELNKKLPARSTSLGSWHLPHVASVCSGLYTSLAFHECCDNTWILHRSYPPLFIQKHPFTNEFHTQLKKKREGGCCLVQYNYVCILEIVEMQSDGWPYIHNYVSLLFLSSTFDLFKYTNIKQDDVAMNLFFWPPVIGQTSQERTLRFVFWAFFPFCLPVGTWCHCTHLHTGSNQLLEVKKVWEHAILPPLWSGFVISKIAHESLLFGGHYITQTSS